MTKKLYRSRTDRKLCGVCGGIAEYLNADATIVRLACVLLFFTGTLGLWAYIICALVIPEAPDDGVPYQDINNGGNPYNNPYNSNGHNGSNGQNGGNA